MNYEPWKMTIWKSRLISCAFLLCCLGGLLRPQESRAARSAEEQAFSSARALFDDHQYVLAETNFSAFLAAYNSSPNANYAVLYLARSRLEQSNWNGAIVLLTNSAVLAGPLSDEYAFWAARARFGKGDYAAAAEGFASFLKTGTNSPRQLEAACDEAEAYSKMGNWARVADLLQKPDGAFCRLSAIADKNLSVAHGAILLGEAFLAGGKFAEGIKVVSGMDATNLESEWQWRRLQLLCQLELAGGRAADALLNSSNLLDSATGPRHLAASWFLRGQILEALGRPADALQSYTNNLADDAPAQDQQQAILKTVELTLAQNSALDAAQWLEIYVAPRTNGAALDLARLSLGELYLKIYYAPKPADEPVAPSVVATNYLLAARLNFDYVITNSPGGALEPRAHLDRGWCFWSQTNMAAAEADFQFAADRLDHSPDQAVARFKLADTKFHEHDYTGAVSNYNSLMQDYARDESVTNGLFDQALYQIIQASLDLGDQAGAEAALKKILDWYPNSLFGDRGGLLIGQSARYDYNMVRERFGNLLKRSPRTPYLPEVQFAIARTYELDGKWGEAMRGYDDWLKIHATNAPRLLPQVEYARALVCGKAGMESNALALFTNFVARFPTNTLAPWAQNWVADYYFNQGDNEKAEENYEALFVNSKFPDAGDLSFHARLMAGRAALARQGQGITDARVYFSDLVADTNAPANLVSQGYFALGDTIFQQFLGNPSNLTNRDEAIRAISTQTNGAPTNALAALAYGILGNYHMQWADLQWETNHDPTLYNSAVQMYQTVVSFPATNLDAGTRSQAEVGLGRIAEKQHKPELALLYYSKVLDNVDPDQFDPFWLEQAGKAAGHVYEQQQQWDTAIEIYRRIENNVPALRASLEKAIINARSDRDKARN